MAGSQSKCHFSEWVSIVAVDSSNSSIRIFPKAGYIGLNVAALLAGVEFGLQPLLHHTADGQALYSPYGLHISVPAMVGQHLLIFGWVEAIVTALVIKFLQKQAPELLKEGRG